MSWEIKIPYQSRDQSIREAIECQVDSALPMDDRGVFWQIVWEVGAESMGQLIDRLESLGPAGQRKVLDKARAAVGLKSTGEVDADEEVERATEALRRRPRPGLQHCAAENCSALPMDEQGLFIEVSDRRWWCDRHRDQAGPDDHLPPEPKYAIDFSTMSEVAVGEEAERLQREERELQEKADERLRVKLREGEAIEQVRRRYEEDGPAVNVAGWMVRPGRTDSRWLARRATRSPLPSWRRSTRSFAKSSPAARRS
jgi:hypothetical protein